MIEAGLKRLVALRHEDGGFGWWESDASDPAMTALVVRGLSRLLQTRPDNVTAKTLRDGAANALLEVAKTHGKSLDVTTRASMVLALAHADKVSLEPLLPDGEAAWRALPPMAQALLLRAALIDGEDDLVATLRGYLDDTARRDGGLLSWGPPVEVDAPERWQDDAIETTAHVLLALLEADVRPEVLEGGARWLLKARLGGDRWRSTRDTAAAVEFLAAYVRETGDLGAGRAVALILDRETVWEKTLTAAQAAAGPAVYEVPVEKLAPGTGFTLALRCAGGAASAAVALRYHETGPAIAASDAGFTVTRRFQRLVPHEKDGLVLYTREAVTETVPAGTLVECELVVKTPRPREYVMITSPHAGGFEAVRETGMEIPGRAPATEARSDVRDDRTMFFVARLAAGEHVFRHTLRAEHVGSFAALPGQAELMYFPDVRGNSNGELWQVTPAGPVGRDGER
jgi:hypothetical protein